MEGQSEGRSWGSRLAQLLAVEAIAKETGFFEQEGPDGQLLLLPYDREAREGFELAKEIYREGIRREWERHRLNPL